MSNNKRVLFLFITLFLLNACVSLNSVSLTQIPVERDNFIEASSSRIIFLAFNFDNDYVDDVERKLRAQCRGGQVKGILTKDETVFLLFFRKKIVSASGYCIR